MKKKKDHSLEDVIPDIEEEVKLNFRAKLVLMTWDLKSPSAYGNKDEEHFGEEYAYCVSAAVGEFADLLTQFLIAKGRRIDRRAQFEILTEAMRFSRLLADWNCRGSAEMGQSLQAMSFKKDGARG